MRARLVIAFTLVALVAVLGPGCTGANSIVGGECVAGYAACEGHCVAVSSDPDNCGECHNRCEPGIGCSDGACVLGSGVPRDGAPDGPLDGALLDGAPTDGSGNDGSLNDGSSNDGSSNDGSLNDGSSNDGSLNDGASGDGGSGDGGSCPAPPFNTNQHCGACGNACSGPNPICLENGASFACGPPCTPPLVYCPNRCVDLMTDPFNCGACGKFCPSNLCIGGVCQGATPGNVVVIGHDYSGALGGTSQARVLTNAVFIPTSNPVRVLSYEEFATAATVTRVKSIIDAGAGGRTVSYTVGTASTALEDTNLARNYDVVLLYDQQSASANVLATRGTAWAPHFATFTQAGGTVVALDGNAGQGAMPTLFVSSGLLNVASHSSIAAGSTIRITAPSDRVATAVASPYGSFARSVTFTSNEPNGGNVTYVGVHVVGGVDGAPVVIHKVVP